MRLVGVKKFHSLLFVSSISLVLNIIALLSDTVVAAYLGNAENEKPLAAIIIIAPIISVMACVSTMLSFVFMTRHSERKIKNMLIKFSE